MMKNKRKSKILQLAKGFRNARSTKYKQAKQGVIRAGQHAFAHRRKKKRIMRKGWQVKINYAVRDLAGISYSVFMDMLHKKDIAVDRKIMCELVEKDMAAFARLVSEITGEQVEAKQVATAEKSVAQVEEAVEENTEEPEETEEESLEESIEEKEEK